MGHSFAGGVPCRGLARAFGILSIVSFALAIALTVYSWSPPQAGSLAQALGAPAPPTPAPAVCPGLKLSGGHSGCLALIQITCRPSTERITAEGVMGDGRRATAEVSVASLAISFMAPDGTVVLSGGQPRTFDVARGADVDTEVGFSGSPDRTRVVGLIPCGF